MKNLNKENKKMEENKKLDEQIESGKETGEGDNSAYIDAINEMKKNYVPKKKLDDAKAENKKLLDALVSGKQLELPDEKQQGPSIQDLRNKLFKKDNDITNLEYVKTALDLRAALIEAGERDPFLPVGDQVTLTAQHYEKAEAIADGLQHCVDFADGDSGVFTAEYQRVTKDPALPGLAAKRGRR